MDNAKSEGSRDEQLLNFNKVRAAEVRIETLAAQVDHIMPWALREETRGGRARVR